MLDEFITTHRGEIVQRARKRVAERASPQPTDDQIAASVRVFLEQLGDALRLAKSTTATSHEQIGRSATKHGGDLLGRGLTIAQVVHDYGDICQVITQLAVSEKALITGEEFQTLNLCLDDAIADAVTEYSRQREVKIAKDTTERLGVLAHEMRNLLNTAMLAFGTIRNATVAPGGATSVVLGRSLTRIRDLIDRSLADVRLDAGIDHEQMVSVADFVAEIEIGASLQAHECGLEFVVTSVDNTVTIQGDRQILAAAVANLLQNAFKFTKNGGKVSLSTHTTAERVMFDVEDECGGLPSGKTEELFQPYSQHGNNRSGIGLGLSIVRKAAHASGGEVRVRDMPGKGCVFTLDLPRQPPPPLSVVDGGKNTASAKAPIAT